MKVIIQDGKLDKGLRLFKKKIEEAGVLKDLRDREYYLKPSAERKLKKSSAKKRWKKFLESTKLPSRKY